MIVYSASKAEFTKDVALNRIEESILDAFRSKLGQRTSRSEIASWRNSMMYMNNLLMFGDIPNDAGVAIEYQVPLTSKRVDFILSGQDASHKDKAVIVELKQWEKVARTHKDAIVETFIGGAQRQVTHPSYQAWTYAALIRDFNSEVQRGDIALHPCAYLHNCKDPTEVKSPFYAEHMEQAPVFIRNDAQQLQAFLTKHIRYGDRSKILERIEHGRLRPSKGLADHLVSLLQGNREFEMIDEQKIVYETALDLAAQATNESKQVLLVEGGPGTGKSVVAVNLLVEFTNRGKLSQYVSRNAAPRAVYESKLTGTFRKSHVTNLFKGSGVFHEAPANTFDCLVVDEAHRLNEKSGFYQNLGENQVKEIIEAAKVSVFFLDQDQRVTFKDIGDREEIRRCAQSAGAALTSLKLESQFRCNGSDGYLAWVNHALQIEKTANESLQGIDFDFHVFDSPNALRRRIKQLNETANKARMVAGYCWEWKGKKDPDIQDVTIPEHDFAMRWNLDKDGSLWIVAPESVSEIGCIHTCQGLELDYVGVVIGKDLVVRNGVVITNGHERASQDQSIKGFKSMYRQDRETAEALADRIIKNTYRTLMTRGQKGCYVFCVDRETNEYFKRLQADAYPVGFGEREWPKVAEPDPPAYTPSTQSIRDSDS